MTATNLAAALEKAVAHISPTPSGAVPIVEVSADLLRDAARRLREVEGLIAAVQAFRGCACPVCNKHFEATGCERWDPMVDALRRAMGGQ